MCGRRAGARQWGLEDVVGFYDAEVEHLLAA
jgi:hypothetical protein